MSYKLRILSLGAGVQSSTLLLMAEKGEIEPFSCAIFADTGWESEQTYLWLEYMRQMVMTPRGYCYEIEIKVSRADIKRDLSKPWGHEHGGKIRKLYFAIPEKIESAINLIPESAGILVVSPRGDIKKLREAKQNQVQPLNEKDRIKLAALGTLRIWSLKRTINSLKGSLKVLNEERLAS
jgi:hypothetical protein